MVIANAAIQFSGGEGDDRADRLERAIWQRTLDVNLTGAFLTIKHGVRALLAGEGGAVVCCASPAAPGLAALLRQQGGNRRARARRRRATTRPTASASTGCCPGSPTRR